MAPSACDRVRGRLRAAPFQVATIRAMLSATKLHSTKSAPASSPKAIPATAVRPTATTRPVTRAKRPACPRALNTAARMAVPPWVRASRTLAVSRPQSRPSEPSEISSRRTMTSGSVAPKRRNASHRSPRPNVPAAAPVGRAACGGVREAAGGQGGPEQARRDRGEQRPQVVAGERAREQDKRDERQRPGRDPRDPGDRGARTHPDGRRDMQPLGPRSCHQLSDCHDRLTRAPPRRGSSAAAQLERDPFTDSQHLGLRVEASALGCPREGASCSVRPRS